MLPPRDPRRDAGRDWPASVKSPPLADSLPSSRSTVPVPERPPSTISGSGGPRVDLRSDVPQTGPANYAGACRRTPRHTTHHKDLPEHVTITRPQHPLEGKTLAVFGQRRYTDKLHLILILPKGGRALIPKEWTDIETLSQDP